MKYHVFLFIIGYSISLSAQINEHINKGFVASGYDIVSYFDGKPAKGKKKFSENYKGNVYKFSKEENLKLFENDPEKFLPQYGGWCAYALSSTTAKANVNPKTYEIRDGKLYLFYNAFGTNTLDLWLNGSPSELKNKANINWKRLTSK